MRAREFIAESFDGDDVIGVVASRKNGNGKQGNVPEHYADVSPGSYAVDGMDKYYDLYRMSMIMAGGPDNGIEADNASWIANAPFLGGYTHAENEKIEHAIKKLKATKRIVGGEGSREPQLVNKQSPIKAFKGYPR